jgi:NADH-quinone oxidoreductase subunit J
LSKVNSQGNVAGLAQLLFTKYVFAFEVTSALLITAALGAMVLAHRERLVPKPSQAELARKRMQDYASHGRHPGPMPNPGVFARHNAVDTPALLPDGSQAESSVSRVLSARGGVRPTPAADVDRLTDSMGDGTSNLAVTRSGPRGPIDGESEDRA